MPERTNFELERLRLQLLELEEIRAQTVRTGNELSVDQLRAFCGACVSLGKDGICTLRDGKEDQPRYVARNWCGWAEVDGKRGVMTNEGFKS